MQPNSQVSYAWQDRSIAATYRTGVSLHSHTSASEESLTFIHKMGEALPFMKMLINHYAQRAQQRWGIGLDFVLANWRPPLVPRMAWDLEHQQIADLNLAPLISITDHDNIEAPTLLRTTAQARAIPYSLEWTTSFGVTSFHLGIHNLPSMDAQAWLQRLQACTLSCSESELGAILRDLHAIPQVLIVLNHPLWDLYKVGKAAHEAELDRFLLQHGSTIHALELNGLRHAQENREVAALARRQHQLLISGGDRHGLEPNANINLTNAQSFTEFVHEIRVERKSHVLFMDQYKNPWEQRILDSTLEAISDHPGFSPGWQRWDERAYHPDQNGVLRPLAELWPGGRPPHLVTITLNCVRLFRYRTLARALSITCPGVNRDQTAISEPA